MTFKFEVRTPEEERAVSRSPEYKRALVMYEQYVDMRLGCIDKYFQKVMALTKREDGRFSRIKRDFNEFFYVLSCLSDEPLEHIRIKTKLIFQDDQYGRMIYLTNGKTDIELEYFFVRLKPEDQLYFKQRKDRIRAHTEKWIFERQLQKEEEEGNSGSPTCQTTTTRKSTKRL